MLMFFDIGGFLVGVITSYFAIRSIQAPENKKLSEAMWRGIVLWTFCKVNLIYYSM